MGIRQQKKVLEVLRAARKLLSDREHWVKGKSAVNKEGTSTSIGADDAVAFCSSGSLWRVTRDEVLRQAAATALKQGLPKNEVNIAAFNDRSRTRHSHVMEMFDKAIRKFRLQIKTV